METQNFNSVHFTSQTKKTLNKINSMLFYLLIIASFVFIHPNSASGSDLIKLADGNSVITLSGGKIAILTPPPVSVIATLNLPGAHIGVPIALGINPAAIASGWFVIPTTGGIVHVISSSGVVIGSYNLPGDHIGEIVEFGALGDFAVQTTGGLFSFFDAAGSLLGTINLPGEHAMSPVLLPNGDFALVNQNNEIFIIRQNPDTGEPEQVGVGSNLPGSPAYFDGHLLINQNNQIFVIGLDGKAIGLPENLPGAFAFFNAGVLLNQNNQVFNIVGGRAVGQPLNLPGAPAARPLPVGGGRMIVVNQNFQIFNINQAPAGGGGPQQIGAILNLPGAPACPLLVIPGGGNAGNLLAVNQNGQVFIVNPGNAVDGPSIVGDPINLANSPMYVVENGIPGVYVVASSGGHVEIIDTRGPFAPVVLASIDCAGEHKGPPVMDKDVAGNNYAKISTTSGEYIIDKTDFTFDLLDAGNLGGHLVCCMGPVMPGAALSGQDVPVACDMSMAGEQELGMAIFNVFDANTGELVYTSESFDQPFETTFQVPPYALPGDAFTVTTDVFGFDGIPVGQGAAVLSIIPSIKVEAQENLEATPGDMIFPTFEISNLGFEPAFLHINVFNEFGWFCEPQFTELALNPGESITLAFEAQVPEFELPCTNKFILDAFNLENPAQSHSDYLDATVFGLQQTINLNAGWGGLSSYLMPQNPEMEIIFEELMDELVILAGMEGFFWPAQNTNTIGQWDIEDGYKIKVENDISLNIKGTSLADGSLTLEQGWHIIPVLSSSNVSAASLLDVPEIMLAKEIAGNRVFWPGQSIVTLSTLETGNAYVVLATNTVTLNYLNKASAVIHTKPVAKVNLPEIWNTVEPSPNTHLIAIPKDVCQTLEVGDVVAAFSTQDVNTGHAVYTGESFVLAVYGDDQYTTEVDGMLDGEEILLKVYRPSTDETFNLDVVFDPQMPDAGNYTTNGLSGIALKTGFEEFNNKVEVNVFPNPASHFLNIDFGGNVEGSFEVIVINSIGMNVYAAMLDSSTRLDVSDWTDGFYFIRITNSHNTITKKIVISK